MMGFSHVLQNLEMQSRMTKCFVKENIYVCKHIVSSPCVSLHCN